MSIALHDVDHSIIGPRSRELFLENHRAICRRTDRIFAGLLAFQWLAGIAAGIWISPYTWRGRSSEIHPHVWAALGLGSLITFFPILLAVFRPGQASTRHVIAAGQMLWSALFIHLTGGRIETHFHVFGSLAFLAFYRDWRVLLTATGIVAADHFLRGLYWPESVYGVVVRNEWRWLEHAGWVVFEDVMLFMACRIGIREAQEISVRRVETELLSERRYEAMREYEALVNSVEGVVWESEADTMRFTFVSRQVEPMLGYPTSNWTESPDFWKSVVHPEDRARVEGAFARKGAGSPSFEVEYRTRSAAGQILMVRNAVSVVAEPGRPVLLRGMMTDITEKNRLETMKNEFISNVSHELRTPLTSIRGSLGLVASGVTGPLPPAARGMIDVAFRNSERLTRLVNDILDLQKIESNGMELTLRPTEIMSLLAQAVDSHQGYAQSCGVDLMMSDSLPGAFVRIDTDRMSQVIANLLSNACKFSSKGGSVGLSVTRRGKHLRISVSDRGPGIPDAFRARIFQKFAQAETGDTRLIQGKGTGLGLSISKAIVESLGGTIGFDSEVGRGSTFYVELPEEPPPVTPEAVSSGKQHQTSGERAGAPVPSP
jgi:two-component system sensor histidine kinase/response regulator